MKKLTFITILLISNLVFSLYAQDQTINGDLTTIGDVILKSKTPPTPFGEWGKRLAFGAPSGENGDAIFFSRVNIVNDHSELRLVLGDDGGEKFMIGYIHHADKKWHEKIVLQAGGRVGIGVSSPSCPLDVNGQIKATQLDVNGTIRSKEVKIEATGWADFVFDEDYRLPKLSEVESHIKTHKHLPDVPSEKQVVEEGVNVVEMQAKLLQKIEELTLYVIEQDKKIKELEEKLENK